MVEAKKELYSPHFKCHYKLLAILSQSTHTTTYKATCNTKYYYIKEIKKGYFRSGD